MQSYKLHVVKENLESRMPYLELPFNDRYDKTEVYHAVFDRSIPKLIEILLIPNIESYKYRDALITLNEMCSHQENKDQMITQGLVGITSAYLHHKNVDIRAEAVSLLGSLVSIQRGKQFLEETSFMGLKQMLFDESLKARESCAWCLGRILTGRDGVDIVCKSKITEEMIKTFLKHTEKPKQEEAPFIIRLLEAFVNILQYDNGIVFFIGQGIIQRFNSILTNDTQEFYDRQWSLRLNYLCLDCLAKICANHDGKQEALGIKIISTASNFLDSPIPLEVKYSVILIMNCAIHLEGKKQCTLIEGDTIILKLIQLLDSQDEFLRKDVKQSLLNIAEFPEGFLTVVRQLSFLQDDKMYYLEEVFGPRAIIALANLLPKTVDLESPPILPIAKLDEYKKFCYAICHFILSYDQVARTIAVEEVVKIVEKLVPFVLLKEEKQLQDNVVKALHLICENDEYSKHNLIKYLNVYGDIMYNKTNLNEEIKNHKYKKLAELLS